MKIELWFFYRPDYSHNFGYSDDGGKHDYSLQTNKHETNCQYM